MTKYSPSVCLRKLTAYTSKNPENAMKTVYTPVITPPQITVLGDRAARRRTPPAEASAQSHTVNRNVKNVVGDDDIPPIIYVGTPNKTTYTRWLKADNKKVILT